MRILIAEDDSILTDGLTRSLRHSGYAVDAVSDGRELLMRLTREKYGLVLLEQNLPEAKGLDLVPAMRALQPELKLNC